MKCKLALTLAALAVPAGLAAQQSAPAAAAPVVAATQSLLDRYGANLSAAAREMPADKYGFKPTPQQMTFGQVVSHIASSNNVLCAHMSDLPVPAEKVPEGTAPKDELVAALDRSFTFCKEAASRVDESKLGDEVPFFGQRNATRAMVLLAETGDLFDHYSALAIYLRLNGLLPPTARPRPAM